MLTERIDGIELKIKQLLVKIEDLQKQNTELLETNRILRTEISKEGFQSGQSATQTKEMEEKKAAPLAVGRLEDGGGSSQHWREEIELYVREIEKCIEWLQNY